jgi:hypothetical protein
MASYDIRKDTYKGSPVLEILVNGGPWGDTFTYDEHFRFGQIKARMIVTCLEIIEAFEFTQGHRPGANDEITISRTSTGLTCSCTKQDQYTTSHGKVIEQPYLRLDAEKSIGFGVKKAEAIVSLQDQIREFARGTS